VCACASVHVACVCVCVCARARARVYEQKALKVEEARMTRVVKKLKDTMDAAKGQSPSVGVVLGAQGESLKAAALCVGHRLSGTLPLTWTVSMLSEEATGTLRVLYRPPPLAAPQVES